MLFKVCRSVLCVVVLEILFWRKCEEIIFVVDFAVLFLRNICSYAWTFNVNICRSDSVVKYIEIKSVGLYYIPYI